MRAVFLAAVVLAGGLTAADKNPIDRLVALKAPESAEEKKDDPAEVKAAKKIMRAELRRVDLIDQRIRAGSFTGGAAYLQLTAALNGVINAAVDAFPEPKEQLPWFEYRLEVAEAAVKFNQPRVEQGVEEPQLLPQLEADVARAELALLKLKKKIKEAK